MRSGSAAGSAGMAHATAGVAGTSGDCGGVSARAEAKLLPSDVVWAIDTSGSMSASFPAIQQALNQFSNNVIKAGVDAHIVLLAGASAGRGSSQGLCVPAPLGSGTCGPATKSGGAAPDSREPNFLHLDLPFGATAGMATLLDNYTQYKHLLRPSARIQFVLTEDGAPLTTAAAVVDHIEGRASATGTAPWSPGVTPGSYQWNGILCKDGTGTGTCLLAFGVPEATLDLIAQTSGMLGNLDDAGNSNAPDPFAALLDKLAEAVIVGARVSCDYAIPTPPQGQVFDRSRVNVLYSNGMGQTLFRHAPQSVKCGDTLAWKYDDELAPTRVVLCPAACTQVQADASARIDVSFGCATTLVNLE